MNEKGFTLIEVILSIAILGIIVVSFINIFSIEHISILRWGNKSQATYNAIEKIEEKIVNESSSINDKLEIKIGASNIEVPIEKIELEGTDKNNKITTKLTVGIPHFE